MEINIIVRIFITALVVFILSLKAVEWVGSENTELEELVILTAMIISSITLLASAFAFIWTLQVG